MGGKYKERAVASCLRFPTISTAATMRIALAIVAAVLGASSAMSLELRRPKLDRRQGTLFERAEHAIEYTRRQYAGFSDGDGLSPRADGIGFE